MFEIQQKLTELQLHLVAAIDNAADPHRMDIKARNTEKGNRFQDWHKSAQAFFEKSVKSAPQLALSEPTKLDTSRKNGGPIVIDDDSDAQRCQTPVGKGKKCNQTPINPSPIKAPRLPPKKPARIDAAVAKYISRFTLEQLRSDLYAFNGGVYGTGDIRVFEGLVNKSIQHWSDLLSGLRLATSRYCGNLVAGLIHELFSDLKKTKLFRIILKSADEFLSRLYDNQETISDRLLSIESGKPMILDDERQVASKIRVLNELSDQFRKSRTAIHLEEVRASDRK